MGELRATHSVSLSAPPIGGGTLQIIQLAKTGDAVKAGDVVIAFDPSEQEYNLAQNRSDLAQAEEEIVKARDDAAVQAAEDQTALLKDRFAVRQAQLTVEQNELVSAIQAKENILALDQAKRALAQLEQDVRSHAANGQASVALNQEKRNKARLAITEAEHNIAEMQLPSPIDGLVVIQANERASGGFFFPGMSLPDFQIGDQVNPGNVIANVIDIAHMQIAGKVEEADRSNVQPGDPVEIQVDSIPGATFPGKVESIASVSATGFFSSSSGHKIDVTIAFDHPDPRLRPGFSAHLVIQGVRLHDALTIPREAVFEESATPTVYVKSGGGFVSRSVKVRYLTESTAVIDGLKPGEEVALVNPEQSNSVPASPATPSAPSPGPVRR